MLRLTTLLIAFPLLALADTPAAPDAKPAPVSSPAKDGKDKKDAKPAALVTKAAPAPKPAAPVAKAAPAPVKDTKPAPKPAAPVAKAAPAPVKDTKPAPKPAAPVAKAAPAPVKDAKPAPKPATPVAKAAPAAKPAGVPLAKTPVAPKDTKWGESLPRPVSPWRISAGYVWRNLGGLHFDTNPRAQGYTLPVFDTSNLGPAGSATAKGTHTYKDGFVYSDTSGPNGPDTWFWGYSSNGQLTGNDLAFHGIATAYNQTSAINQNPGWDGSMSGGGPIVSLQWQGYEVRKALKVGAEFSVSLIQAKEGKTLSTLNVQRQVSQLPITDHYTVDAFAIPGAPYSGDFNFAGPIIFSSPDSRKVTGPGTVTTTKFFDRVSENLDLTLTTLSFGPTVSYEQGKLTGTAGLGLALNITSWDAEKTDSLFRSQGGRTALLGRWHSHASGTEVLPGFYLQAAAAYAINDHWSVQAFGRYDWSRALEGSVGGSSFSLDLTGWSVGAGVVYRF